MADPEPPARFDPREELRWRFELGQRRVDQGIRFGRGKICYGVYSRRLLAAIAERVGRVFPAISPDYTSMVAALGLAECAVDAGAAFQITLNATQVGHGNRAEQDERRALDFLRAIDPSLSILDSFPIPRLYASTHNVVSSDYCLIRDKVGGWMSTLSLDRTNLIIRIAEDLELHESWHDQATRAEQWALWQVAFDRLDAGARQEVEVSLDRWRRGRRPKVTFGVFGRKIEIPVRPDGAVGTAISRGLGALGWIRRRLLGRPPYRFDPIPFPDVIAASITADPARAVTPLGAS